MFERVATLTDGTVAFHEVIGHYTLDYIPRGATLVVSFEPAAILGRDPCPDRLRPGWGQKFVVEEGHSFLAVKSQAMDWYRGHDLHAFFRGDDFQNIARRHEKVIFYGSSMGAYAAIAFARVVPGAIALAMSPQSTLDPRIVPWERGRFQAGLASDWSGDFADAAEDTGGASAIFIVYDPFHPKDRKHVSRFRGNNIHGLKLPFGHHTTAALMQKIGILRPAFRAAVEMRPQDFPKLARQRRLQPEYRDNVMSKLAVRAERRKPKAMGLERRQKA